MLETRSFFRSEILMIPAHVVSIFYGLTPGAAKAIAPLLFFYGWNTYVVFENGKVVARSEDDDPPLLRAGKKEQ